MGIAPRRERYSTASVVCRQWLQGDEKQLRRPTEDAKSERRENERNELKKERKRKLKLKLNREFVRLGSARSGSYGEEETRRERIRLQHNALQYSAVE